MISKQRAEKAQAKVDRTVEFQKRARSMRDEGLSFETIAKKMALTENEVRLLLQFPV